MKTLTGHGAPLTLLAALFGANAVGQTVEPPQAVGLGPWTEDAVLTIGETVYGYTAPGIPDGMGAFDRGDSVEIVSNHELRANAGYPYTLANGTELTGARISSLIIDKSTRQLTDIGPAFDTIINRAGIPAGQADSNPTDLGNWETSGILDVTELFGAENERLMFLNVQAHSLGGGVVDSADLVEGGQYLFLSKPE